MGKKNFIVTFRTNQQNHKFLNEIWKTRSYPDKFNGKQLNFTSCAEYLEFVLMVASKMPVNDFNQFAWASAMQKDKEDLEDEEE